LHACMHACRKYIHTMHTIIILFLLLLACKGC
jgi:hypothetical protein